MSFQRALLSELITQAETEIEANLPGADAALRRTVLGVLARVNAGAVHGLYGYLDWMARQILPDTAEGEFLDRHASIWGVERKAAAFATGTVDFTGTDGVVIAGGSELKRSDGLKYVIGADVPIQGGVASVTVTAQLAGADGVAAAGQALNLTSPIAGIDSGALVAAGGLVGGTDEETNADLLARVLARIQQPPHGGADFDYVTWALDVAGVTRAWVYAQELGLGTVTVRFMMDEAYADGIPLAADVNAVQTSMDAVRPVTADLTVLAPIAVALDVTVSGLDPATQAVKDAITAELADLIKREAVPGGTILISHIREGISIAAGEADHVLVSPVADIPHTTGQIATMGAITWI